MAGQWLLHHCGLDVARRERVYVLAIVTLSLLACCNPSRAAAAASTTLCDASTVLADFTDPGPVPSAGGRYVTYSLNGDPVQQDVETPCNDVDGCTVGLDVFPSGSTVFDIQLANESATGSTVQDSFLTKPYYGSQAFDFGIVPPISGNDSVAEVGGRLVAAVNSVAYGTELWVFESRRGRAYLLDDLYAGAGSSNPRMFTAFPQVGRALFVAQPSTLPAETEVLYMTNGEIDDPNGVRMVRYFDGATTYYCRDIAEIAVFWNKAFFSGICDVTAGGAKAGHGSRAYYMDASLGANVIPFALEPPTTTSQNPRGFGMWDGRLFFTVTANGCDEMCIWNKTATPTKAIPVTTCSLQGAVVPDALYPCGAAGMMMQAGAPAKWLVEASNTGDPAIVIATSASLEAVGGVVWNEANGTAFMVARGATPFMFAYTAARGDSVKVAFPDGYWPSTLFGLPGRGHSTIAWDVVMCVGQSSASGDTLVVLPGGGATGVVVDAAFPSHQTIVHVLATRTPDGDEDQVAVVAQQGSALVVYRLGTDAPDSLVPVARLPGASFEYARAGPQHGVFVLGTSQAAVLVDLASGATPALFGSLRPDLQPFEAFGGLWFVVSSAVVAPSTVATRTSLQVVTASGGDVVMVGGLRLWANASDGSEPGGNVSWLCQWETATDSNATLATPALDPDDPLAVYCTVPYWGAAAGDIDLSLLRVSNQPQVSWVEPDVPDDLTSTPPPVAAGLVPYPPWGCAASGLDTALQPPRLALSMVPAWWSVSGLDTLVDPASSRVVSVVGTGFTPGAAYSCYTERQPGVFVGVAADVVPSTTQLTCTLPALYNGSVALPPDTVTTSPFVVAAGAPTASAVNGSVLGGGTVALQVFGEASADLLLSCRWWDAADSGHAELVAAVLVGTSDPLHVTCGVPAWPVAAARLTLQLWSDTLSSALPTLQPEALKFTYYAFWSGITPRVWLAGAAAATVNVTGGGFAASSTYTLVVATTLAPLTEVTGPSDLDRVQMTTLAVAQEQSFAVRLLRDDTAVVEPDDAADDVVHVVATWTSLSTNLLSAQGGVVRVHGRGFNLAWGYTCLLNSTAGEVTAAATTQVVAPSILECTFGRYQYPADTAQLVVQRVNPGSAALVVCMEPFLDTLTGACDKPGPVDAANVTVLAHWWADDTSVTVRADGGSPTTNLTLRGVALDPQRAYECCFQPLAGQEGATACGASTLPLNTTVLVCDIVVWAHPSAITTVLLLDSASRHVVPRASGFAGVTVAFAPSWQRLWPSSVPAGALATPTVVTLYGFGFHDAASVAPVTYRCSFLDSGGAEVLVTPFQPSVNVSAVQCTVPTWLAAQATLHVSVVASASGATTPVAFVGPDPDNRAFTFRATVSSMESSDGPAVGAGARVLGHGFASAPTDFQCTYTAPGTSLVAVSVPEPAESTTAALCRSLAAPASCGVVTVAAGGVTVPPLNSGQPLTFAFTSRITAISPDEINVDGGDVVTVTAYGLRMDAQYECTFTALDSGEAPRVSAPVSPLSETSLACVAPPWHLGPSDVVFAVRVANGTLPGSVEAAAAGCSAAQLAAANTVGNTRIVRMLTGIVSFASPTLFVPQRAQTSIPVTINRRLASVGVVDVIVTYTVSLPGGQPVPATPAVLATVPVSTTHGSVTVNGSALWAQLPANERQPNPLQYNIRLSLQTSNQGAHVEDPFTMDISVCGAGALVTTDSDGSRCESCALGTYNNGSRLQKCHQCPASQYTSTASRAVGCTKCPQGSFTAQPGASSALECRCQPVGWYRSVTGHCERCDASDKTALCVEWQGSEQVLAEGWWLPASGRHANNTIDSPTRCYETSAAGSPCLGGDAVGRCAVGHQGFLCSECSHDYYRLSNTCQECPTYAATLVAVAVPVVLCGVVAAMMLVPLTEKTRFSKFALAVNLFQFVSMAGTSKIQWPQLLVDIYEAVSFWNLNIELVSPDCLTPMTVQRRLIIFETVPLALVLLCWLWVLAVRCAYWTKVTVRGDGSSTTTSTTGDAGSSTPRASATVQRRASSSSSMTQTVNPMRVSSDRRGSSTSTAGAPQPQTTRGVRSPPSTVFKKHLRAAPDHAAHYIVEKGWRATIIVAFISYMAVSRELFAATLCGDVAGRRLLLVDMRVDCDSDEYTHIMLLVIIGVIVYPIGVLVAFAGVVWAVRHRKNDSRTRRMLGILYAPYKPELHTWELVSMFKRLLLVLVNGLVPLSLAAFKFAAFTLLVSAYLALLGVFRPYKEASTNVVAILTNYCQVLTAFGGVVYMFTAHDEGAGTSVRTLATVTIVTGFVVVAVVFAVAAWRRLRKCSRDGCDSDDEASGATTTAPSDDGSSRRHRTEAMRAGRRLSRPGTRGVALVPLTRGSGSARSRRSSAPSVSPHGPRPPPPSPSTTTGSARARAPSYPSPPADLQVREQPAVPVSPRARPTSSGTAAEAPVLAAAPSGRRASSSRRGRRGSGGGSSASASAAVADASVEAVTIEVGASASGGPEAGAAPTGATTNVAALP